MKSFRVVALGLALFLVLAGAVSASAPIQNTGVWAPEPFELPVCDFPVYDSPIADYREQIFFDKDDSFVKWRNHAVGTDYLTAPGTSDVMLSGQFSLIEEWDEPTQTFTATGIAFNITVPGYGIVLFEAGRLLPSGRLVGVHTSYDLEKMAILCSVLAGE